MKRVLVACVFGSTIALHGIASTAPAQSQQRGMASWYGPGFQGRKTASGERFNTNSLTAAHRSLPFGSRVRVTNERTGRSVVVRINDRGPFVRGRVIDLSTASARAIGVSGVSRVSLARQ
jgi:rare lipoprotein A